ncbi:molybdenum cofactor guanylyltransferase [Desulfovibrio sp.]|uniref:molybdenum cofactor guanylyltransferase n=1 Tax=Desulfovibrio sp. TaxID=885 RepID=UPI0025C6F903|nr:molybdenum cofactor guanylyltransferase [Desulfovibrio sp.]
MNSEKGRVAGVVLAGGLSSRMGADKARLRLPGACGAGIDAAAAPDLLFTACALVRSVLPLCLVSCRADAPRQGYDCVFDALPGQGPAAGLQAALRHAGELGYTALLALSCDLPLMDAHTLRRLLAARDAAPPQTLVTAYRARDTGRVESLTAVYEVAALPYFDAALARGERKLGLMVPGELRHFVDYGPEESEPFFNCNCPADLEQARTLLAQKNARFAEKG